MLLQPKKIKYRKYRKKRLKFNFKNQKKLNFGLLSLKILEPARLTSIQLESRYRVLTRKIKKNAKISVCVFPMIPVTSKPREVRMGKGKGNLDYWATQVKAGTIIYQIENIKFKASSPKFRLLKAKAALIAAASKLPCKCKIINNNF